jgi:phosphocarrier protein
MKEQKVTISNELGLHARPSALFVKKSTAFKSEITVCKDGLEVNGKSIMSLMMLAAEPKSEIVIRASGDDEDKAINALTKLVKGGFKG